MSVSEEGMRELREQCYGRYDRSFETLVDPGAVAGLKGCTYA